MYANQLNLFQNQNGQEEISMTWLFNYMQLNYPEMKFNLFEKFGETIIKSFLHKKVDLEVVVRYKGKEDTYWLRKYDKYISLSVYKQFGNYEGWGYGADTIEEFKEDIELFVNKAKKNIEEYKNKGSENIDYEKN